MRAVEKMPVGENLSVPKAPAKQEEGEFKWGPSIGESVSQHATAPRTPVAEEGNERDED